MKKMFEAECGSDLADQISEWIVEETDKDSSGRYFRPCAVVELFDQNGDEII